MTEVQKFWEHWNKHDLPHHPAAEEAKSNDGALRFPIGVSGDDAKYTLAGSKFIVVMISSVLYKVKRFQVAITSTCFFVFQVDAGTLMFPQVYHCVPCFHICFPSCKDWEKFKGVTHHCDN